LICILTKLSAKSKAACLFFFSRQSDGDGRKFRPQNWGLWGSSLLLTIVV
jgi:hypothetical protein